ncbi:TPA: hypothetical protein N0F65_010529 [Lagenidium giganteum]|uniref:Uncharacterized protein n=1 Tax=Lagenidium giganteum TaxID=4803 RepID=A0AAV2ZB65_9STRA|nr:TPA: hypothetical protein N0F65_010529 [Lagenidium giganteum]
MSDFTDQEDRLLVQCAKQFADKGRPIAWSEVVRVMHTRAKSTKSKAVVRQRLKTLKRTHGHDLNGFPPWFFRPVRQVSAKRATKNQGSRCIRVQRELPENTQDLASSRTAAQLPSFAAESAESDALCSLWLLASTAQALDAGRPFRVRAAENAATAAAMQDSHGMGWAGASLDEDPDAVLWPVNRISYEELKESDLHAVDKLFTQRQSCAGDDAPILMKWCIQHKCSHPPARSSTVFHKRLVVISSFRIWTLKPQNPFAKTLAVRKEFQLLHCQRFQVLQHAVSAAVTSIRLEFTAKGSATPVYLHLDAGVHTESFVRLLQRLLHGLRYAFSLKQAPRMEFPTHCHWREYFTPDNDAERQPGPRAKRLLHADAITMAYRAFCDDLHVPFRPSVVDRLQDCAYSAFACVDFHYCLKLPSALALANDPRHNPRPAQAPTRRWLATLAAMTSGVAMAAAVRLKEVQALARTLENFDWFENIMVYDYVMEDAGVRALFQSSMSPTSAIRGFSFINVHLSARALTALERVLYKVTLPSVGASQSVGGVVVGLSSPRQPTIKLRRLDLSFNAFSFTMVEVLARIIGLLRNGLEVLQLEKCSFSEAASAHVLQVMKSNAAYSASLRDLNLSGNVLGRSGTQVLASWITGAFGLQRLDLSRCQLDLEPFLQALAHNTVLAESSLAMLDLSYNRMTTGSSAMLGDILGKSQSLAILVLRGMRAHPLWHNGALFVHQRFKFRRHRRRVPHQRASGGGSSGADRQRVVFPTRGLQSAQLRQILGPMLQNASRSQPCDIDLSENNLSGSRAMVLADLFEAFPHARQATLRLDHVAIRDSASVLLLRALAACRALESLSLEGNGFVERSPLNECVDTTPSAVEEGAAQALTQLLRTQPASSMSLTKLHVTRPPPVKELCLSSEGPYVFGAHVLRAAIHALAYNAYLQVLDVSGNECGDAVATALGDVLPVNKALQVLFWDRNHTTVDGFHRFYQGLTQNRTLVMVQMPIYDTRYILEEHENPPRERLFGVLGKIFKLIERNQTVAQAAAAKNVTVSLAPINAMVSSTTPASVSTQSLMSSDNQASHDNEVAVETEVKMPEAAVEKLERNPETLDKTLKASSTRSQLASEPQGDSGPIVLSEADEYWNLRYREKTNSRYASVSQSWSKLSVRASGTVDDFASWNERNALGL